MNLFFYYGCHYVVATLYTNLFCQYSGCFAGPYVPLMSAHFSKCSIFMAVGLIWHFFLFLRLNHLSSIVVGFLPQTSGSFPIYFLVRTIFWRWRRRLIRWRNCNILKYWYFDSFLGVPFFMEKPRKNSQLLSFRQ